MDALREHYDALWRDAAREFQAGRAAVDPLLASGQPDRRRGLTLILRLGAAASSEFVKFLEALERAEPGQYVYPASDFHITLLSLFTASEAWEPFFARAAEYEQAASKALASAPPITVRFQGITASSGAIMIQGFPADNTLETLRERLRAELRVAGLGGGLDQRYRLQTAHATVFRFRHPLASAPRFLECLEAYRHHEFGTANINEVLLVENDWYMSATNVRGRARFALIGTQPA